MCCFSFTYCVTFVADCSRGVAQYVNPVVCVCVYMRWTGPDSVVSAIQLNNSTR